MRERRLGTPAGTVPRRDDTRPDTIGEVVDGRLDPRLHALACQMIAAEDDVDRLAPERAQRAERCVDDAACEHDESTLTPRPRTRAARNRSSRIKGSGTVCPSRTVWCPMNPAASYPRRHGHRARISAEMGVTVGTVLRHPERL